MVRIEDVELQKILEKYGIADANELDQQLGDSQVFYEVESGTASAGSLMTCFLRMWPKETMDRVAKQLIEWLTSTGYLRSDLWSGPEKERIGKAFIDAVEKLCDTANIPQKERGWYSAEVGSLVNGNAAIIHHVSAGDFSDIEQFFAQVHRPTRKQSCVG